MLQILKHRINMRGYESVGSENLVTRTTADRTELKGYYVSITNSSSNLTYIPEAREGRKQSWQTKFGLRMLQSAFLTDTWTKATSFNFWLCVSKESVS